MLSVKIYPDSACLSISMSQSAWCKRWQRSWSTRTCSTKLTRRRTQSLGSCTLPLSVLPSTSVQIKDSISPSIRSWARHLNWLVKITGTLLSRCRIILPSVPVSLRMTTISITWTRTLRWESHGLAPSRLSRSATSTLCSRSVTSTI